MNLLLFAGLLMLDTISKPYQKAKMELTQLAQQMVGVVEVNEFSFYNGLESYSSLLGETKQGESIAVLKKESDKLLYVYRLKDGISQEQAERVARDKGAEKIDKITFGRLNDKPIWEVKSDLVYYVIDFETGTLISKEGL
ncbi:hypothetical protein STRDD10_01163 [Streptococcus sp. DD10]|nr:hypothetical protein STRDD10_01163 [Streptococcus sp. DD10]